jgi:hypothetical protein
VLITSVKIGVAHEYGFRQPAPSTHDRGYELAQALCRNAERSYSQLQTIRGISEAIPRHGDIGGHSSASAEPCRERREHLQVVS